MANEQLDRGAADRRWATIMGQWHEDRFGEEVQQFIGRWVPDDDYQLSDNVATVPPEEHAEAAIDAAKAKTKAAKAAEKSTIKKSKDKIKAAQAQPVEESHMGEYTFGTGDIIKNINPKCKHFGSQGIVKKMMDVTLQGPVAVYTVTNNGNTFKSGDTLVKTIDQLAPIQSPDDLDEKLIKKYEK